jgi:hypothetical protein
MTLEDRISKMVRLLESISIMLIDFKSFDKQDQELAHRILEVYIQRWRKL